METEFKRTKENDSSVQKIEKKIVAETHILLELSRVTFLITKLYLCDAIYNNKITDIEMAEQNPALYSTNFELLINCLFYVARTV